MDGKRYRVRVRFGTIHESARLEEGINAGKLLSGDRERDLVGTYYSHSLEVEPDPRYPGDYDAFYEDITAPVPSHTVTMPHGQGTMTYEAMVSAAEHGSNGVLAGVRRWNGLSVSFVAKRPQRRPG